MKLLDASDGRVGPFSVRVTDQGDIYSPNLWCLKLRASYRIVDHRERHVAPHSIAFNTTADRYIENLMISGPTV